MDCGRFHYKATGLLLGVELCRCIIVLSQSLDGEVGREDEKCQ